MNNSIEKNFLGEFCPYDSAKAVVLPAPLEKTTSYIKGTCLGPEAIIRASQYLELYDIELKEEIYKIGIHTLPAARLEADWNMERSLNALRERVSGILNDGKFPVVIGGEHSIAYASLSACMDYFADISVLHIDAHGDLRNSYEDNRFSHACVLRRIRELTKDTVSVGIRSLSLEEAEYIERERVSVFYDRDIQEKGMPVVDILDILSERVYITLDFDALNPSEMPSVGTPEPGGLGFYQLLSLLKTVSQKKSVVGFDAVELRPDNTNVHSEFCASKLIYKMIGYRFFL